MSAYLVVADVFRLVIRVGSAGGTGPDRDVYDQLDAPSSPAP
ncbi:MAG: hypothetical protein OXQ94_14350 [Gemmatimonadota bacterium]|nr:hypothetical protein [Gemmatimonadota bacterium]MDE2872856.1 hypothetical protein [Gemmatimonadota bacterium]